MTRIALALDDLGLHAGVNAAALALAGRGRLNAVSCMVGAPAWPQAREQLAAFAPGLVDVGLHLDLTEAPLRAGVRHGLSAIVLRAALAALPRALLGDEIEAQLDAFEDARGAAPDHVDGHQHVHQLPQVREALVQALQRRYPQRRPWLRSTRHAGNVVLPDGQPGLAALKPRVIEVLGARGLARLARRYGMAQNGRLLGVYDFCGGPGIYHAWLLVWLAAARDGDLLMCHASAGDADPRDAIAAARSAEFSVLSGAEFDAALRRHGVTLVPISRQLADAGAAA